MQGPNVPKLIQISLEHLYLMSMALDVIREVTLRSLGAVKAGHIEGPRLSDAENNAMDTHWIAEVRIPTPRMSHLVATRCASVGGNPGTCL